MMSIRVFCDFDGTVALNDVGDGVFERFTDGSWVELVQQWKAGKISSRECLIRECELARMTPEKMAAYADEQDLDPHFHQFVDFCQKQGISVIVVSDGLDFYIARILKRHGLSHVPFRSNRIRFEPGDRIRPEFPYYEHGCRVCGNCKGYHVRQMRQEGDFVIFVGDGYSDRCGVKEADLVLAKGELVDYCRENSIGCREFADFSDVLNILRDILAGGKVG